MSEPVAVRDLIPPDVLSDEHLLVALTGSSAVRDIATTRSLHELADQTPAELRAAGLSPVQARKVAAAFELARRLAAKPLQLGRPLRSAEEIVAAYEPRLRHVMTEQFWILLLDARSRLIREELVSQGTVSASLVHPREVLRCAIRHTASSVILLHQHPSGDPEPSPEDHEITRRLAAAGELIGIPVRDHLVIGGGGYTSFAERGHLPN